MKEQKVLSYFAIFNWCSNGWRNVLLEMPVLDEKWSTVESLLTFFSKNPKFGIPVKEQKLLSYFAIFNWCSSGWMKVLLEMPVLEEKWTTVESLLPGHYGTSHSLLKPLVKSRREYY